MLSKVESLNAQLKASLEIMEKGVCCEATFEHEYLDEIDICIAEAEKILSAEFRRKISDVRDHLLEQHITRNYEQY